MGTGDLDIEPIQFCHAILSSSEKSGQEQFIGNVKVGHLTTFRIIRVDQEIDEEDGLFVGGKTTVFLDGQLVSIRGTKPLDQVYSLRFESHFSNLSNSFPKGLLIELFLIPIGVKVKAQIDVFRVKVGPTFFPLKCVIYDEKDGPTTDQAVWLLD